LLFEKVWLRPRDGLTLFGPLDEGKPHGIRGGVIGTAAGIAKFTAWVDWLQRPVRLQNPALARPFFPGFEAAFRVPWNATPVLSIEIDENELPSKCGLDDRHQRVFQTVELFSKAIVDARRDEESKPDVWFVVIPDYVRRYCRPEGIVAPADRHEWQRAFKSPRQAKELCQSPSLFAEANEGSQASLRICARYLGPSASVSLPPTKSSVEMVRLCLTKKFGAR
jgi:hypothetical protein